ncbi:peritrophin-1-like [Chironomus tepperi]|uniref:peritrophin-1-like n=1 Tax=Chironomus tepperi TaxID=113505 RepID=UPI00391F6EAF
MKFLIFAVVLIAFVGLSTSVPTCPAPDGDFVALFPHETDCTKFWKCDRGVAFEKDCPIYNNISGDRLHFDRDLSVCNWPWAAGCA